MVLYWRVHVYAPSGLFLYFDEVNEVDEAVLCVLMLQ